LFVVIVGAVPLGNVPTMALSVAPGTLPQSQLLASNQNVPSPAPVQVQVVPLSIEGIKKRKQREQSVKICFIKFILKD
jgi:hypothetical protein